MWHSAVFPSAEDCGLRRTPVRVAARFLPEARLVVKLEGYNRFGSIKARTAHGLLRALAEQGRLTPGMRLVESSSGNLGLALAALCREAGCSFLCLVDPPPILPHAKLQHLIQAGVAYEIPPQTGHPDHRSARIAHARALGEKPGTLWLNQYDNPANPQAHEHGTGPELLEQLGTPPDYLVCSVGTGGTVCGLARFFAAVGAPTRIIAVEPEGSTIFGGAAACYLSAGAGLRAPSGILIRDWGRLHATMKVPDPLMIAEARRFRALEGESVGVTTGGCLVAARVLARQAPGATIAVIAPDSAADYECLTSSDGDVPPGFPDRPPDDAVLPRLHPVPPLPDQGNAHAHHPY